jgi:hypothetical protein
MSSVVTLPPAYVARLRRVIASSRELLSVLEDRARASGGAVVRHDMARQHLAQGERIVAEQKARIADLKAKGLDTTFAQELLVGFNSLLELMRDEVAEQRDERPGQSTEG